MAGLIGHGDAFVLRDPSGIRPTYFYEDDEVVVVASERPAIQTVFNAYSWKRFKELDRGHALDYQKEVEKLRWNLLLEQREKKVMLFRDEFTSQEEVMLVFTKNVKNLGKYVFPQVLKSIDDDITNTVFSFIPNTAETSFYGMTEAAEDVLNAAKNSEEFYQVSEIFRLPKVFERF